MKNLYHSIINGLVYLQAPLKAFELTDDILMNKYRILSKEIDVNNEEDLLIWVDIINNSYDDCVYNKESAKQLLTNHPYLSKVQTFLFKEIGGGEYFATVSIGTYKGKPNIGSDFRIGVRHNYQGKGYGRLVILYAFSKLQASGVKFAETIISFKRNHSLYLHYSLGFKPQLFSKWIQRPSYSKFKRFNYLLTFRLMVNYHKYLKALHKLMSK